ncbi:MAG: hypothetical protein FJZ00_01265 [Candidatus Sericytochromatia bacterium]|uniref:DUF2092 domain-containing protein n=1 Tax=Candidatus Tanganyikabacteria bacterium TaxID=2961651 RepID=A0A938BHU3_9BACT|nr:hypothetical protein [Candidatus Tanganyikabacteria bacterium]
MRNWNGLAAACVSLGVLAGCANLQNLLTPQNIATVQNVLKQAGVSISYKDPNTGETKSFTKKDDVKTIKNKDGKELKQGEDYDFQSGKLVFKNLKDKQTVTIVGADGTTFKTEVEPENENQQARFIPDANGQFDEIEDNADFEKEFAAIRDRDAANRVTFKLGGSFGFKAADVKGFGFRPKGQTITLSVPRQAWAGVDGGVAMDVQALGDSKSPDDPKDRIWTIGYAKDGKILVVRFKITKTLKRVENPTPDANGFIDFSKVTLPGPQTVDAADLTVSATASYDTEQAAAQGENLKEPVFQVGPVQGGLPQVGEHTPGQFGPPPCAPGQQPTPEKPCFLQR